ncbi:MAG: M24 family metallopeptidase [Candidatus Methanofastidiosia archaeon]
MKGRVKKIFDSISGDIDVIVIANHIDPMIDSSFFYVTGYETGLFEGSVAFLYPDGSCVVLVSLLEETSARRGSDEFIVFRSRDEYNSIISERLKGKKRIGINAEELVYKKFELLQKIAPDSTFVDCSKAIISARSIKDKNEIERIRKSCGIASKVADMIPEMLHTGVREDEVAAEIEYNMKKLGADGPSFTTISSFGKNSAEPHYTAGKDTLTDNVFALFDFGAIYSRYVSDITRTFFFGKASKKDKAIYETVFEAQQLGFDTIQAGIPLSGPHIKVANFINNTPYKGRFIHSLGHGIGLSVHEMLRLSPLEERVIEPGMVLTVEPGIYLPGYGGVRIEDDVLVKKNGIEILTTANKEFLEV